MSSYTPAQAPERVRRVLQSARAVSRVLNGVESVLCATLVVAFSLLLLINVTLRYGFARPLYFAEEACVLIMIWMAFLATSLALARRELVAVTLLLDHLPARPRRWLRAASDVVVILLLLLMLYAASVWILSDSVRYERAITLGLPKWPFFAVLPAVFATMSVHAFVNVLEDLWGDVEPRGLAEEARLS